MPITINTNVASLQTQRRLGQATSTLQKSFERLSSGLRINKASDDASGLSIASGLNTDTRVYNQGVRNLNDGISVLNIAEGALDAEAQALRKEYLRIAQTTEFNGRKLFDGNNGDIKLQAGYGTDGQLGASTGGKMGDGTVRGAVSYQTESNSSFAATLGDLNGDGVLDLISAGYADSGDGCATIRLGNGDGSFKASTSYQTESTCSNSVGLGDLNGDGVLDLVTAGYSDSYDGYATMRLGNGDGSFGAAVSYQTESLVSYDVGLGDLNGDGVLDLVTAGSSGSGDGYATSAKESYNPKKHQGINQAKDSKMLPNRQERDSGIAV